MPNPGKGELLRTKDGLVVRLTIEGKQRECYPLAGYTSEAEVEAKRELLADLAKRFRRAGVIRSPKAQSVLRMAASQSAAVLKGALPPAVAEVLGTAVEHTGQRPTFREVRKRWTSGELHRLHPDHVKAKDSALDASRAETMEAIDIGGGTLLGDLPIDLFTLETAEIVMRNLPAHAKRPATRRGYAQILRKVLSLAVYPVRAIKANPIPKEFMPKIGKPPAFPYLYPAEDAALLACQDVPLCYRILWGVLDREGPREGEACAWLVRDFDLKNGTVELDRNKTNDPRTWPLDPGVCRALKAWVKLRGAGPDDPMFVDESGGVLTPDHRLAERLREHLLKAGVTRRALHHDGTNTRKMRVHDLRATFVTLSLANGQSQAWVTLRTGHQSGQMVARYTRQVSSAAELNLGPLLPLDEAIPELCQRQPTRAQWQPSAVVVNAEPLGSDASPTESPENRGSTGTRTQDQRIKNPLL
jgi:integrase